MARGSGFPPGDSVRLVFGGALIDMQTADTNGNVTFNFAIPRVVPGVYLVVVSGRTGVTASAAFTGYNLPQTPVATPTPVQPAPPVLHDNRYFSLTAYRIDDEQISTFFQTYGMVQTFGYPASRRFTFLGCPVQFFQPQVIQNCPGQGAELINILDPDIFPFTVVNGSTFPPPDPTMKANTQVSDPNYSTAILTFINAKRAQHIRRPAGELPELFQQPGQSDDLGRTDLTASSGPHQQQFHLSALPARDHALHPGHRHAEHPGCRLPQVADPGRERPAGRAHALAQNSPYLKSYCPGQSLWMCRPNQVPGTDYTFAFVPG